MEVIHLNNSIKITDPLVVTIGQFDGIHTAHQSLINKTVNHAKTQNAKSAVITFIPHIDTVLRNLNPNDYIIDFESKKEILTQLNVDYLLVIDFNLEVSKISHKDFFERYLNNLNIYEFIVGFDFTYGYLGSGNIHTIQDDYHKNVKVTVISKQELIGEKIGSFEIKKALAEGNIAKANQLLGYNFFMNFKVDHQTITRIYLKAPNLSLLKKQDYHVLINNKEYILTISEETFIENHYELSDNHFIKTIFIS